jgi:hypothetical protein
MGKNALASNFYRVTDLTVQPARDKKIDSEEVLDSSSDRRLSGFGVTTIKTNVTEKIESA